MYNNQAAHLGSWWNSWDDFTSDVGAIFGGGSSGAPPGTLPPGARPPGFTGPTVVTPHSPSSTLTDDLATVTAWKQQVLASGSKPSRMPSGPNVGELAQRINGPGTNHPEVTAPPFTYVLAPDDVLDADMRLQRDDSMAQLLGALIPADVIGLNNALQGITPYVPYLLGGAALLAVLALVGHRE